MEGSILILRGRVTLVSSVLDALSIYMMSLFPSPDRVIQRIDKIRRDFLRNGKEEDKGFHLVKWCKVMHGKKQGGLGIRNLKWQS